MSNGVVFQGDRVRAAKYGVTKLFSQHFNLDRGLLYLGRGALLGVLVIAGWLLPVLGWQVVLSPPPPLATPGLPTEVAHELAAQHLFGRIGTPSITSSEATADYRLVGVIFGKGQSPSLALLLREGESRPQVVASGGEVAPGLRLARVERQRAVLSRDGRELVLQLPEGAARARTPGSNLD